MRAEFTRNGLFGPENSSAIAASGIRSASGKICATRRRMKSFATQNLKLSELATKSLSAWATRSELWRSRVISKKIEATIITLEKSIPRSDKRERAMRAAYAALSRLDEIRPKISLNCAHWRPIALRPISASGSACRLNGAGQVVGQFPRIGIS